MLPANVMGVGTHITPVVLPALPLGIPTPGVTMGIHAMAVPPCPTILLTCQPALNMASIVPTAPNIPPILIPPVIPQLNVMGVPTILLMCLPATIMTSPAVSAGPPGLTSIPDVTTVFLMYAAAIRGETTASGHPLATVEDMRAIERSLAGPMVESRLLSRNVGYVAIRRFSTTVPADVFHAVEELTAQGMESLVVDLRGNAGGEMGAFLQLTADFLREDDLIVTMVDTEGDETEYHVRQSNTYDFPVVVLVDSGTASAAEVFAGCLQAHGRATLIGQRTYGKGGAQAFVPTPEGLVYATVATFRLPDGRSLRGAGVEPDLSTGDAGRLSPGILGALALLQAPPALHQSA
ncbi:MAG TPA: S41 family peptidase [Polyangiaceae bacterium]|jgi:carboxyl-terminal processing protease